jgi:hypothetical protein
MSAPFQLNFDAFGKLVLQLADGTVHHGVVVVRAFPIAAAHAQHRWQRTDLDRAPRCA